VLAGQGAGGYGAADAAAGAARMSGRQAPEKRLQAACRQVAALYRLRAWHVSQARATQQSAGLPDDFYTGGRFPIACEYKAGRNKQTAEQAAFQVAWEASGGTYWVIRSVDEFIAALGGAEGAQG
jgi:hypothetical protein